MRLTVLLVTVIGCASCQGSVPIHSGENGNEERGPTPVIALEAERERTAPSPNLVRLPPNAFTDLATDVIANLERRGCTIPRSGSGLSGATSYAAGSQAWIKQLSRCCAPWSASPRSWYSVGVRQAISSNLILSRIDSIWRARVTASDSRG